MQPPAATADNKQLTLTKFMKKIFKSEAAPRVRRSAVSCQLLSVRASRGFTLVELLIAMTIFIVVVAISISSFVRALRGQQAIVALISTNDNASLALEQMAREIRTSKNFSRLGDSGLEFQNADGETVTYELSENKIMRRTNSEGAAAITAANVKIERLSFTLLTSVAGRPIQPRVTITMRVSSPKRDVQTIFTDIQTTVSPRVLN